MTNVERMHCGKPHLQAGLATTAASPCLPQTFRDPGPRRNIHRRMHANTFYDSRRSGDGAIFATDMFHRDKSTLAYGAVSAAIASSCRSSNWLRSVLPQTSLVQGIAYHASNTCHLPVASRPTKIPRPGVLDVFASVHALKPFELPNLARYLTDRSTAGGRSPHSIRTDSLTDLRAMRTSPSLLVLS